MGAAAFGAGEGSSEYKLCCDKRIGLAMAFAECVNAGKRALKSGAVADDARVRLHKPAKFSARSVSEGWRRGGGFRRESGSSCVIA
jgi:hypothetical protein